MSVLALNPQDCLKNSVSRQAIISSPPRKRNPKPKHGRSSRAAQQNRTKRSPNSSPQSRHSVAAKLPTRRSSAADVADTNKENQKLVMGQVRILRRGEMIEQAEPIKTKSDLNLGFTEGDGPDSQSVKNKKTIARSDPAFRFYAGSAFINSPPPSSLPLPTFFTKKTSPATLKCDDVTNGLCRVLNLN